MPTIYTISGMAVFGHKLEEYCTYALYLGIHKVMLPGLQNKPCKKILKNNT
jgi:hypothetical protein